MNGVTYQVAGRQAIEKLGFEYAEDVCKCLGHTFNNIPVRLDLRDKPEYELGQIELDLNEVFLEILKMELRDAGIKRLYKLEWDRIFFIGEEFDPRKFTARFYVRILGEDTIAFTDTHYARA
jgi:hypothetical protein